MQEGDPEGNLLSVIGNAGGNDLLQEAAEFSLDAVLGHGIVRDIPVVGTVAKLYNVAVGVQGYVFARKVRRFLTELSAIPQSERDEFSRLLDRDPEHREQTADVLVTMLAKMDDSEKAAMLARAFARHIQEEFDFPTFRRLAAAIDRCLVVDLWHLEKLEKKPTDLDGYVGDLLVGAGLAIIRAIPTIQGPGAKTTYGLSELGKLFLQVVVRGLSRSD